MILQTNRKVFYDYQILETFTAGIKLFGYEAKALREGRGRLEGSYVVRSPSGLSLINFLIPRYSKISQKIDDSSLSRSRSLLLKKSEVENISFQLSKKGISCVPVKLLMQKGMFKLEIAVVRGKREFEKKIVAKEKEEKRELEKTSKKIGTWGV
jgi:SsrA-binding protein